MHAPVFQRPARDNDHLAWPGGSRLAERSLEGLRPATSQTGVGLRPGRVVGKSQIENPVNAIERPKVPKGRIIFLKEEEAIRLLKECRASKNKMLYPYILTLLHTAMRPSEAAGLRWDQVDLKNRSLTLFVTKNEPRTVPLTQPVVNVLQELRKDNGDNEFVFLKDAGKSTQAKNIPSSRFRPSFDKARERAGLQQIHMHDLRHTAASHMLMAGTDLRTLAAILGHSTLQMVLRYTHLLDDHKLNAVDRISTFGIEQTNQP
ncbi:MAG TPA: site-specific integrase [Desulfobulbaceae bacterium]|nr:site-specific integrase [Desulfobulbaceae bacterium]